LLGSLSYIAQGTRPDIAYAVSALSQFNSCYTRIHWACAKRILRYFKGTIDHGLTFTRRGRALTGYVDADWGNCHLDRRSYTGTVFLLADAAISWEVRKQRTVALSSTEAEYVALSEAAREAIHLSGFLREVGLASFAKVSLHNDNQSAGKLAINPMFHSRSKHIDIKYHFIRQALTENKIELSYTPTEEVIADVLTKAVPGAKHHFCKDGIGIKVIHVSRARI
ncbi:Copia protein, partial [Trachymyrmex cornetzi]